MHLIKVGRGGAYTVDTLHTDDWTHVNAVIALVDAFLLQIGHTFQYLNISLTNQFSLILIILPVFQNFSVI